MIKTRNFTSKMGAKIVEQVFVRLAVTPIERNAINKFALELPGDGNRGELPYVLLTISTK